MMKIETTGFCLVGMKYRTAYMLDHHSNLAEMFEYLRQQRFNGVVEVHLGQGGVSCINCVQFTDTRSLGAPPLDFAANMS